MEKYFWDLKRFEIFNYLPLSLQLMDCWLISQER